MRHWLPLALLVVLSPCCGSGGGGGGAPLPTVLTATVGTPVGQQHMTIPIGYVLYNPTGGPVSITVEWSNNGGGLWATAKPASINGPLTGLSSSPTGTPHTFLWNSYDDAAAYGAAPVNNQVRIRITPSDGVPGVAGETGNFSVSNKYDLPIGSVTALFPHTLTDMGTHETELGDLVTDALRLRYGTQLAIQNGWGIRTPLPSDYVPTDPGSASLRRPTAGFAPGPPYDLVLADLQQMLPFGNRAVTRTVTGAQFWSALENGFSTYPANNNGFPQISGCTVTIKSSNPAGSRVQSVVLDGGGSILNNGTTYTLTTNDFMNAGGDGYAMLNDGQGSVQEKLDAVLIDYILSKGSITPSIAGRIIVVP